MKKIFAIMFVASFLFGMIPVNAWVYPDGSQDDNVEFFGPRADRLIIKFYSGESWESIALEDGDIDFTDFILTGEYVTKWTQPPYNETIKLCWRGVGYDTFVLDLNNNPYRYLPDGSDNKAYISGLGNPMSMPNLRHAIAHCVDKDYIERTVCEGYAEMLDTCVPSSYGGYSYTDVDTHSYDPNEAARLLNGDKLTVCINYTYSTGTIVAVMSGAVIHLYGGQGSFTLNYTYAPNAGPAQNVPECSNWTAPSNGYVYLIGNSYNPYTQEDSEGIKVHVLSGDVYLGGRFLIGEDEWRYWDINLNSKKDSPKEDLYEKISFFIRDDYHYIQGAAEQIYAALRDWPVRLPVQDETPLNLINAINKIMHTKDYHMYLGGWDIGGLGWFGLCDKIQNPGYGPYYPKNKVFEENGTIISTPPGHLYYKYHSDSYWHPGNCPNYNLVNNTMYNYWTHRFITMIPHTHEEFLEYLNTCYRAQEIFASPDCVGVIPLWASQGYTAMRRRYTGGTNEVPVGDDEDQYRGKPWLGVVNKPCVGTFNWWTFYNAHPSDFQLGNGYMTLRWGFKVPSLMSLNPLYATSDYEWKVLALSYSGLTMAHPYTLESVPYIAYNQTITTWVATAGPLSGRTLSKVTFHLRDDILWSDGTPLTAEDVKFTWGGPLDVGSISYWLRARGLPPAYWYGEVADILSICTPDPWTVECLMDDLTRINENIILPKHIWEPIVSGKPNPYGTDPTALTHNAPRVGSGPYLIGSYNGVEPSITLTANPLHFNNPHTYPPVWSYCEIEGGYSPRIVSPTQAPTAIHKVWFRNEYIEGSPNTLTIDAWWYTMKWNRATSTWDLIIPNQVLLTNQDINGQTTIGPYTIGPTPTDPGYYKCSGRKFQIVAPSGSPWYGNLTKYEYGRWWITLKEDVTGDKLGNSAVPDGKVDMKDVGAAAKAFGSYPGHARWNSYADINNDYKVDAKDYGAIAKKYGWIGW